MADDGEVCPRHHPSLSFRLTTAVPLCMRHILASLPFPQHVANDRVIQPFQKRPSVPT